MLKELGEEMKKIHFVRKTGNYNPIDSNKKKVWRDFVPIKVGVDRICRKDNEQCYYTGVTMVCLKCSIFDGNTHNDIMFRPCSWLPLNSIDTKLIEKASLSEETQHKIWKKNNTTIVEEIAVIQAKLEPSEPIINYEYGNMANGSRCYVCNCGSLQGEHMCPGCEQIYNEE